MDASGQTHSKHGLARQISGVRACFPTSMEHCSGIASNLNGFHLDGPETIPWKMQGPLFSSQSIDHVLKSTGRKPAKRRGKLCSSARRFVSGVLVFSFLRFDLNKCSLRFPSGHPPKGASHVFGNATLPTTTEVPAIL